MCMCGGFGELFLGAVIVGYSVKLLHKCHGKGICEEIDNKPKEDLCSEERCSCNVPYKCHSFIHKMMNRISKKTSNLIFYACVVFLIVFFISFVLFHDHFHF